MSSPILRGGDLRIDRDGAGHQPRSCAWSSTRSGTPTPSSRLYANVDGYRATRPHRRHRRARPLHPGQDPRAGRGRHRRAWTPTTSPAPAPRSGASSTRSTTGTSAASRDRFWAPGSGGDDRVGPGQGRRLRHAVHGAHHAGAGRRAAAAVAQPRRSTGTVRRRTGRRESVHLTDWPDGDDCPPIPSWWPTWTGCARSARRPSACARTAGLRARLPLAPAHRRRPRRRPARPLRRADRATRST